MNGKWCANSENSRKENKRLVALMAEGKIVLAYDIASDGFCWAYGMMRIPVLPGCPMSGKKSFPIEALPKYMEDFYWPNRGGSPGNERK